MKGFIASIVIIAALLCWGIYNYLEVSRLDEQLAPLKKQVAHAESVADADKAGLQHSATTLINTENELSAANKKIARLEKQVSDQNALIAQQTAAVDKPSVPAAAVQQAEQSAPVPAQSAAAPDRQQQTELAGLKAQSAALATRQQDLQRRINAVNNKLMSGGGRETGWYYLNKDGSHNGFIHTMAETPSRTRRVQWVYESKEESKAREAAPLETELTAVITQKAQIDAKINQKQLAKE
ncbi:MAG: hypothetical protein WCV67_02900 [Victivallaceae bacterium]|jgi:hypothetical protein